MTSLRQAIVQVYIQLMKVSHHKTPYLLTFKEPYPIERLIAKQGAMFQAGFVNRASDTFKPRTLDLLRSFSDGDPFKYSSKPKQYVIPDVESISPTTWPDARWGNPREDVMSEYDTIINFASAKGSSFLAPGLIDEPVVITKNLPYKPAKGTPYTERLV